MPDDLNPNPEPNPSPAPNNVTPNPSPPPSPSPTANWFDQQPGVDAEVIGHMQSHGWDRKSPVEAAIAAVRSHQEAQKLIGAPPDELIRVPKSPADEAGWAKLWQRLGTPTNPEDYKFDDLKLADGSDPEANFTDFMRATAAKHKMPAETAKNVASDLLKFLDGIAAEETAQATANLTEQKAFLDKNWGPNKEANMFVARNTAAKLGFTPQMVSDLEKTSSYATVMEMFRKIGQGMGEADFLRDPSGNPQRNGVMTRDQAVARKAELMKDEAWKEKYLKGSTAEAREMTALNIIISGASQ